MEHPTHPSGTRDSRDPTNTMYRQTRIPDFDCTPSNVLRLERQVAALERDLEHSRNAVTEAHACSRSLIHLFTRSKTPLWDSVANKSDSGLAEPPNVIPSRLSKATEGDSNRSAIQPHPKKYHDKGTQCQRPSDPGPTLPRFEQQNKSSVNLCEEADLLGGDDDDSRTVFPTLDLHDSRSGHSLSDKRQAEQTTEPKHSIFNHPPQFVRRFVSPSSSTDAAAESRQSLIKPANTSGRHDKPRALPAPKLADSDFGNSDSDSDASFTYTKRQNAEYPLKTTAQSLRTFPGAMPPDTIERGSCFVGSECAFISM